MRTYKKTMKKIVLIFAILLVVITSCKNDDAKNYNSGECFSNTNAQTLVHDGLNREYILYVHNSYDETSATPILFNFHGFGGSASQFMQEADMR